MTQRMLRIPGVLKHTSDEQTDTNLQEKAREYADRHPGIRFLADVLRVLHGPIAPLRNAKTFYGTFNPGEVMDAFAQRPDLRVKAVRAITGSPAALLRRLSADALASQIDLLAIEDLPESERSVRAEADRGLSVHELYLKYVDPVDVATYLPAQAIWKYESHDDWWKWEPTTSARVLMTTELRLIRRHAILTDSEIIDALGEDALERHLPLAVRTGLRKLARRAAADGRPYTDTDMFAGVGGAGGTRDLIDELVESVPLPTLRQVMVHAGRGLGMSELDDSEETTTVTPGTMARETAVPTPVGAPRVGPKPSPLAATPAMPIGKPLPPTKTIPPAPGAKVVRPAAAPMPMPVEPEGPPQPDDDLALLEELSGRVV